MGKILKRYMGHFEKNMLMNKNLWLITTMINLTINDHLLIVLLYKRGFVSFFIVFNFRLGA